MPSKRKSVESFSSRIDADSSSIVESNVIAINSPTPYPLDLSNSNQSLSFSIPSNPRYNFNLKLII
ncbi:MAG: hypothetical protein GY739_03185 [Mesoflavibacter sp.]|nr:hypothetical protein [Mesoflavibacter sp.]